MPDATLAASCADPSTPIADPSTPIVPLRPRRLSALGRPVGDRGGVNLLAWALPAVITAVLGGWRLTGPALWADELATWGAVRLSWDQLWQLSRAVDGVLTPYYAAMKAYAVVAGTSTVALRLPSVLAMVVATVAVVAIGRRLGGRRAGLTAGLLFAVLPVTSRYAQEARPYAVVMAAAALAVLCLVRLLDDPGIGRGAGYAAALLLAALSHPLSALLALVAHAVTVAVRQVRAGAGGRYATLAWLGAALPGGLTAVVLLGVGYRSRAQVSWIRHLTLSGFEAVPQRLFLSGAVGGIVLVLAVLAVRGNTGQHAVRGDDGQHAVRRDDGQLGVAAAGFVPVLVLLAADQVTPLWVARYVLVAVPALAVLAACAAVRVGTVQAAAVVTLVAVLGGPAQLAVRGAAGHGADSAKVATVIGPRWRPGDVVVFPDTHPSIPWAPRDLYDRYLPVARPPDVLALRPPRTDGRLLALECPEATCLGEPRRIWIVRADSPTNPLAGMSPGKQRHLRDRYRPAQRWSYAQLGIVLMVATAEEPG